MKLEHIGIAVKNLNASNVLFAKLLGQEHYKIEEVADQMVRTSFFKNGDTKIELLEPIEEQGPIAKFIERKGEGIHHLAFEVSDIYEAIQKMKKEGFECIDEVPKQGADNKLICFLHPKSCNGVLVELCQSI